ncbi:hypothetical protein J2Y45_006053 [Dyadobacter sp. BE34]|uniref:PIN domain-containing protein n=1 Tax=Dyadobacter fermentans TaxID=94254 RepID=A0ABU1R617_9BACT|nr:MULTISPECIES: hypothetical protein [Dyadobacter]MDR6808841.1 hypothetical protein [Dyadobacter fermentans]MDR7046584.1 hypothetical protein [Dyadobacter sp. BE242]MDR7200897.1 hypothetical protein [Dyadobacter sp. BE34]MDR7218858.1 hypothetical protein [Dyadobacter sp. BE31]MDR7266787.1 hypothetical protein [Dyadobacter sp. BE32]
MAKKDKIVICDTNIWYAIAEGQINEKDFEDCHLIGTFVSAYEFHKTDAMVKKPEIWKDAIRAFHKYSDRFKMEDPDNYLRTMSGQKVNNNIEKSIFGALLTGPEVLDTADVIQLQADIYSTRAMLKKDETEFMNHLRSEQQKFEQFDKLRESLAHKKNHGAFFEESTKPILTFLSRYENIDWKNVDLWANTFNQWMILLARDLHIKLKVNDFNDIMNLIYVKPGTMYWTRDLVRTVPLIKAAGLGHYLLER